MKASSDPEFARFKNAAFGNAKPVAKTPHLRKLQAQAGGKSRVTMRVNRMDHDQQDLRNLLLKGAGAKSTAAAGKDNFASLRERAPLGSKSKTGR